jgi:hypothetical protein
MTHLAWEAKLTDNCFPVRSKAEVRSNFFDKDFREEDEADSSFDFLNENIMLLLLLFFAAISAESVQKINCGLQYNLKQN